MSQKDLELVMGVPFQELFSIGTLLFEGFLPREGNEICIQRIVNSIINHLSFKYRRACELDIEFKQVIPYCVITSGDKIFIYQRKPAGGEDRLHNKYSIGIGGHIVPLADSFDPEVIINTSLYRELNEEVKIFTDQNEPVENPPAKLIGLINVNSDVVGKVHFGMVYHISLPPGYMVEVNEPDQIQGELRLIKRLKRITGWESWSGLLVGENIKYFPLTLK